MNLIGIKVFVSSKECSPRMKFYTSVIDSTTWQVQF